MLNPSVREAIFHLKTAVTFLIFIASKLTNEVPFERRKIYLSTDYNAKLCLGFLIELIEQILHTIKGGEIL
jgi:hypothetical protein